MRHTPHEPYLCRATSEGLVKKNKKNEEEASIGGVDASHVERTRPRRQPRARIHKHSLESSPLDSFVNYKSLPKRKARHERKLRKQS